MNDLQMFYHLVMQYRASRDRRLDGRGTARACNIIAEARARKEVLQTRVRVATIEAAKDSHRARRVLGRGARFLRLHFGPRRGLSYLQCRN